MSGNTTTLAPGLLLAAAIATASFYIHALPIPPFTVGTEDRHPVDAILIAIVLGILVRNTLGVHAHLRPGVQHAVHKVLPLAIILLGAKLDFFDILRISGQALVINLICVTVAFLLTVWMCRRARISQKLGLLIGIGTAICGGTAIAVAAPVIEAEDNETAFAVTTITLLGLVSIVLFPLIGAALDLSQLEFGVWAGTSIHAAAQVMAAAFAYGDEAGEIAVIVKLVRVLLLAPFVVGLGTWYAAQKRRRQVAHVAPHARWTTLFPPFMLGFISLALANTLGLLPDLTLHLHESFLWHAGATKVSMSTLASTVSSFLITVAMAGVGLGVHLRGLAQIGLTPLYVGLFATIVLSGFSLLLLELLL